DAGRVTAAVREAVSAGVTRLDASVRGPRGSERRNWRTLAASIRSAPGEWREGSRYPRHERAKAVTAYMQLRKYGITARIRHEGADVAAQAAFEPKGDHS